MRVCVGEWLWGWLGVVDSDKGVHVVNLYCVGVFDPFSSRLPQLLLVKLVCAVTQGGLGRPPQLN